MASSGDLLADRRYAYAEAAAAEADWAAAADLARQALEIAPGFAPAWFLLGTAAEATDDREGAVAAFRRALASAPEDALGASLRLALLGAGPDAMPPAYIRQLFDDYAERFDRHLRTGLGYRGPEIAADALRRACSLRLRDMRFAVALDLGCGTGLAGALLRERCGTLAGIDLAPAMIRKARAKRIYDELASGDMLDWLAVRPAGAADLALAIDVLVYVADVAPLFASVARALGPGGLVVVTTQTHDGEGTRLGADHRFAHAASRLVDAAEAAGLVAILVEPVSTRRDRGRDVPDLALVLEKRA